MFVKSVIAGLGLFAFTTLSAPTLEGTTRLDTFGKRDVASTLATQLSPGATIVFPQDPTWQNVTERWTKYQAPSFRVAVEPVTEADVVTIVRNTYLKSIVKELQADVI